MVAIFTQKSKTELYENIGLYRFHIELYCFPEHGNIGIIPFSYQKILCSKIRKTLIFIHYDYILMHIIDYIFKHELKMTTQTKKEPEKPGRLG